MADTTSTDGTSTRHGPAAGHFSSRSGSPHAERTHETPATPQPPDVIPPQGDESDGGLSAMEALRRHRVAAVLVTILFTLLGVGVAVARPVTYTGEMRLAVGQGEMSALNIPGYPSATRDMASNYSRWVTDQGVAGMTLPDGVLTLAASPMPGSSVIRIEATSHDADQARAAAQDAAEALTSEVARARAENDPAAILREIVAHAPELSRANAGTSGTLNRYNRNLANNAPEAVVAQDLEEYAATDTNRSMLQVQQDARMERYRRIVSTRSTEAQLFRVTPEGEVTGNDRMRNVQRLGMIGFGVGLLVSVVGAAAVERRRRPTMR